MSRGIRVPVGTDNTGLDAGLAQAQAKLRAFQSFALKIFAVFASARMVAGFFRGIVDEMDRIGKLASQTGLGARTLQVLSRVAEKAGLDVNVLARAYGRLNRELQLGATKLTADALRSVGIELEDLKGSSPEDTLQRVANAINAIEDPARKSAVAMQLFGRQGGDMISLFEAMAERANDVSTLSDQQVRDIERMNDAWTDLKQTIAAAAAGVVAFFAASTDGFSGQRKELIERLVAGGMSDRAAFDAASRFQFVDVDAETKAEQEMVRQQREAIRRTLPRHERSEALRDPFLNRRPSQIRDEVREGADRQLDSFVAQTIKNYERRLELERERAELEEKATSAALEAKKREIEFEIELLAIADERLQMEMRRAKVIEDIAGAEDDLSRLEAEKALAELDARLRAMDARDEASMLREEQQASAAADREAARIESDLQRSRDRAEDPRSIVADSMRRIGGGGSAVAPDPRQLERINERQLAELKTIRETIAGMRAQGGRRFR